MMKREKPAPGLCIAGICIALAGCAGPPPDEGGSSDPVASDGWNRTPEIHSVRSAGAFLTFTGVAEPGGRVVLRSVGGAAYAAAADESGRFEVRIPAPQESMLLQPETQMGQNAAVSPDRLVVLGGGQGPVAVLRAGGPTRRLDPAPGLGAIDSDGRSVLASGLSKSSLEPLPLGAEGRIIMVRPGPDGAWSALLPVEPGEALEVRGDPFIWPGPGSGAADLVVEQAGQGWRVGWTTPGGARQWTWLPVGRER